MKKEYGVAVGLKGYVVKYVIAESEEEAKQMAIIEVTDSDYIDDIEDVRYTQIEEIWVEDDDPE